MSESYANQPDDFLAQEASRGVLDAFDELVRRYQHRIYGFVLQSVSNPTDAREVTQEAFLRAFTAIDQYRPGAVFSSWLFAIARNKAIDHFRSHKEVPDQAQSEAPDYDDPAELLARREDHSQIWERARELLPELHFQALWLRYVEDMELAQIAGVLGKTKTHVKVLLFRARRILAVGLGSDPNSTAATAPPAVRQAPAPGINSSTRHLCSSRRESAPGI